MPPPFTNPSMGLNKVEPRSPDPEIYKRQVANMVRARVEFSREDSIAIRRKVTKWHDLYRGFIRQRVQPFRNQVHLPLLFTSIEAGVAIKHGLLTGQSPFVEFSPSGPEDAPAARRTTALIQQQFEDARVEAKSKTLLRMGDITGTAIFQWSWKFLKNQRPQRVPNPDDPTGMAFTVETTDIVDFDGPWIETVDMLDFFPQPGKNTMQDMEWAVRRYWIDFDDIVALERDGLFEPGTSDDLRQLQAPDITSADSDRMGVGSGLLTRTPDQLGRDKFSKPVEILEMHGVIPNELVPEDGIRNRLITVLNGVVTGRNVQNPMWSGGLPFGSYSPTKDPYSFWGIGKVEPNEKLQATASRIASQRLDAIDLMVDPMFAYNKLANVETRKLFVRSGGIVGGDGPPSEWLQPIIPDMRGLQQGLVEIESLWRWMQLGTAVSEDAIGGSSGSDRQTAREFLGKQENVQRRMVSEAMDAARNILMPLAEAFRAMNSQFLPFPKELRMLGQNAIIDPATGLPIPPDQSIGLQDVILRYDMRAASAMSLIGRSAKQQNMLLLLQALGGPLVNPMVNWQAFYRSLFIDFEKSNPDEFLLPMTPQQLKLIQMAGVMSSLPSPETASGGKAGGSNKVSGSGKGINSDILDQLIQPAASADVGALGAR